MRSTEPGSLRAQMSAIAAALEERLPLGWQITVAIEPPTDRGRPDAIVTVRSPDGASTDIVVECRSRINPADVGTVLTQLERWPQAQPMVVAPFLSARTRRLLSERGASWADATGNLRLALARPSVFVELAGATTNPFDRRDLPLKSLKGAGGGSVRALCDYRPPYTISQLAQGVGLPVASVFRVVDLLIRESLLEKSRKRGAIVSVDWAGLLTRWCEDYSLLGSSRALSVLEPRGVDALLQKLRDTDRSYVVTGSAVALRVAPVAPSRLIVVYSETPEDLAAGLSLTRADIGANAFLVEPFSPALTARTEMREGLRCAALSQVAADLLTSPGRGPAEGEALMSWMRENKDKWQLTLST